MRKPLHQDIISIFSVSSFFASVKHSTQTETKRAEASLQRETRWQQLKGRGFNIPGRSPGAAPLVIMSSRVSQPLQPLGLPRNQAGPHPASQSVGLSVTKLPKRTPVITVVLWSRRVHGGMLDHTAISGKEAQSSQQEAPGHSHDGE